MTFSMRWLSGRDGSRESQVKHFSESCAEERHSQGQAAGGCTGAWPLQGCARAVPGPGGLTWRWLTMQYSWGPSSPQVEVALRRGARPTSRFPVAG